MKQRTLAMTTGLEQYTRKTRRAIFLEEMEQVVPRRPTVPGIWIMRLLQRAYPAPRPVL